MTSAIIPKGNKFSVFIPILNKVSGCLEPVNTELLTDVEILVSGIGIIVSNFSINYQGNFVILSFGPDLDESTYSVIINATYEERAISIRIQGAFTIVEWSNLARYKDYTPGGDIFLDPQVLIGCFLTDEELEALKNRYRESIREEEEAKAAAEEAKREWEQKAATLDGIAMEEQATKNKDEIIKAINEHSVEINPISDEHIRSLFEDDE